MQITDEMVEIACRAHTPQFDRMSATIKVYARDQMRAALESALAQEKAEAVPAVKVKALEYVEVSNRCWDAYGMGRLYRVMKREKGATLRNGVYGEDTAFDSVEAAKAAAQADYESRIRSALVEAPAEPVAWTWQDDTGCAYIDMDKDHAKRLADAVGAVPVPLYAAPRAEPQAGGWTRNDLAKGLAVLDGVSLHDFKSTVGDPHDASNWREYLGRADDLLAHLSAAAAPKPVEGE